MLPTARHLFLQCPFAKLILFGSDPTLRSELISPQNIGDWYKHLMIHSRENTGQMLDYVSHISNILYGISFARNQKKFQ